MKKVAVIFLFISLSILCFAQEKTVKLSEISIGTLGCNYSMVINLEKGDTSRYIYIGFQNAEYQSITDIKSVFFSTTRDSSGVLEFIKDLKLALAEMGTKSEVSWNKKDYSLSVYDFNDRLYFRESPKDGDGYTMLNKKQVEKLINWLEGNGFKGS